MNKTGRRGHTDPRDAIRRDWSRLERRESGQQTFWRSLAVLGTVGWPIALGAAGGSLLGRFLDARFATGIRYTLMLMMAGLLVGSFSAWKSVTQKHD